MPPFWWNPGRWPADRYAPDRATPRQWVADDWMDADDFLLQRVTESLLADDLVRGRRIEVLVQNMVVVLTGEVDSAGAKLAAVRRARSVPGIFDVCDSLTVTPPA